MDKKYHIIPYMIFIVLLLNSVIRFLLGNLGVDVLFVGSVTNGLLMAVPFGFILVNLQEIYLRKSNLYIKLIVYVPYCPIYI